MNAPAEPERPSSHAWLLRRADQAAVGGLSLLALVALAGYWLAHGGLSGRMVDIDRAADQTIQFQLDINEADWPEFAELPGVGETLAKRIVDTRRARGQFADHDDLRRVRGIGPKTLDRIKPYLRPMPDHDVARQ